MATVRVENVADYILANAGSMSAMKLQKLVYYSQAWSLAWTEEPLFSEEIQAWKNGPVVRRLYDLHKGHYRLDPGFFGGDPDSLNADQQDTINKVLQYYGKRDPQWLSQLTHLEDPWRNARRGVEDDERSERVITEESMLEYYSSL
jgi:uncharacterized phage-associated protein